MHPLYFLPLVLASLVSSVLGLFLFFKPQAAIELQRKFYAVINWRIEPISMEKEIRNTRLMGIFLLAASAAAIAQILFYS